MAETLRHAVRAAGAALGILQQDFLPEFDDDGWVSRAQD